MSTDLGPQGNDGISAGYDALLAATRATLTRIAGEFAPAVFASSLAAEDMVLTDLILRQRLAIGIFSLDTGRLHAETLGMLERIRQTYGAEVALYRPQPQAVDAVRCAKRPERVLRQRRAAPGVLPHPQGRAACSARWPATAPGSPGSAAPVQHPRALAVQEARRGARHDQVQSAGRLDAKHDVWHYIRSNDVPYNPLHDKGYPSIGCEPCTRAIQPGEDVRAGRWWWEQPESKECGLHVVDGKLIRIKPATTPI